MAEIGRIELLLALVGLDNDGQLSGSVNGITRLQKYQFLLEREAGIKPSGDGFKFEAYKLGPYSPKLYDDLELLENLGLIESTVAAAVATEQESETIEQLSFNDLMGGFTELEGGEPPPDSYEERRFTLTEKGRERIAGLLEGDEYSPVLDGIRAVKSKFCYASLRDLLKYVYQNHDDMTKESVIRDQILD